MESSRRLALKAALVVFLLGLGCVTVYRSALRPVKLVDSTVYMAAGKSVLSGGQDLYLVTNERGLHYIYPPPFAVLFAPLALLPPVAAAALWYAITIALLGVGLRAALEAATPAGQPLQPALLWIPLLISADPLFTTITRGQLGILMFACSAMALARLKRGDSFRSGLLVGFTTVLKVYSGVLILYFIVRREWRALYGVAAGALITAAVPIVVVGPRVTAAQWMYWLNEIALPSSKTPDPSSPLFKELTNLDFVNNASILATLTHLATALTVLGTAARAWVQPASQAITFSLLVGIVFVARRRGGNLKNYRVIFEWSLAAMIGVIILPVAWTHHFAMLLLPLIAIACYMRYEPAGPESRLLRRAMTSAGILAILFVLTSILRGPLDKTMFHDPLMTARSLGAYCWAALLLCGAIFYLLTKRPPDVAPD